MDKYKALAYRLVNESFPRPTNLEEALGLLSKFVYEAEQLLASDDPKDLPDIMEGAPFNTFNALATIPEGPIRLDESRELRIVNWTPHGKLHDVEVGILYIDIYGMITIPMEQRNANNAEPTNVSEPGKREPGVAEETTRLS